MEAAHDDLQPCRPKTSRQIHRTGELVGLDAHQTDQTPTAVALGCDG